MTDPLEPVYDEDGITLYHGDCLSVMPRLTEVVDMIAADLPYQTTKASWDRQIDPKLLWHCYNGLRRPTTPVLLFGSGIFSARMVMSNEKDFKFDLVWDKDAVHGFLNANRRPLRAHENIMAFYDRQPTYHPQKVYTGKKTHSRGKSVERTNNHYGAFVDVPVPEQDGYQHPRSILTFPRPKLPKGRGHPTAKPVALMEWLIKSYSNPGDLILDNTCGSSSTLVAARNCGRKAIGIEMEPRFIEMSLERLTSGSAGDNW